MPLPLLVLIGIALHGAGGSRAPAGARMLCARARLLQPCMGRHAMLFCRMPHALYALFVEPLRLQLYGTVLLLVSVWDRHGTVPADSSPQGAPPSYTA